MPLDPKDRDRLEKLLNMLGSPNEGEIGNAGRMIKKMADRYNVTPAALCLDNRVGSAAPKFDPYAGYDFRRRPHQQGPRYDSNEAEEAIRRAAEERIRRQQEETRRQEQEKARRQAEARARAQRQPKLFPGSYFGLLARLKGIYDADFARLDEWKRDFIEDVLGKLHADRQMTIRQREMAKAIIKFTDTSEPLV